MWEFLQKLVDPSDFPARWVCGNWTELHGWIHIIADLATFGAYTAIPCVLAYFILKRQDIVFPNIFWLFCIFIFSCGTVHLIEATIFWYPMYRVSALVKVITAVASWITVIALIPVIPKVLHLPGLEAVNQKLQLYTEKLKSSNQELEQFAYVASHDLKAPLRAIDNLSQWIVEDLDEHLTGETREHVDLLRQRVRRMDTLLNSLLEYSRIGRKTDERYDEIVNGETMVQDTLVLADPPKEFTVKVSPTFKSIEVNRMPLEQILLNLITNAIKHHDKPNGTIEINAEYNNDFIFSVRDDGPGIPAHLQKDIFEMFKTLKPRDQVEGSGMGLAIVNKILESYGKTIQLKSAPGQGSTFQFEWSKQQIVEEQLGDDRVPT